VPSDLVELASLIGILLGHFELAGIDFARVLPARQLRHYVGPLEQFRLPRHDAFALFALRRGGQLVRVLVLVVICLPKGLLLHELCLGLCRIGFQRLAHILCFHSHDIFSVLHHLIQLTADRRDLQARVIDCGVNVASHELLIR